MTAPPNIVWVSLESTRADHTSVNGYERDTTPNLSRIAADPAGRSFSRAFAHGLWTLSASASILTGTYPTRHDAGMESDAIPDQVDTVPELLRDVGYTTAGLSTNAHVSDATGLDRGFDRFGWLSRSTLFDVAGPRTLLKFLPNVRRHSGGFTTDTARHSTGYVVTDVAKRWVRSMTDDQPLFVYLHYGDPHHPYFPPLPYRDRYTDDVALSDDEVMDLVARHHDDLNDLIAEGCPFSGEEWAALEAMYDAEIAYTDALVGHLFDYVRERLDDVVFVVTADHGELFGEGGMLAHKVVLDDAVTHVPLVVHGLDAAVDHEGELVQHVDVVKTLAGAAGADTHHLQGFDLGEETRPFAVLQRGGERYRKNLAEFREHDPGFDADRYHDGTVTAVRTEEFKYVLGEEEAALYRLPDEERDVSEAHPDVADRLHDRLVEWREREGRPAAETGRRGEFTGAMQEQLADLGYLE